MPTADEASKRIKGAAAKAAKDIPSMADDVSAKAQKGAKAIGEQVPFLPLL